MTPQKYRSGKQLGLWVSTETAERLAALSRRTKLPQSDLLREALELLFAKHAQGPREPRGGRARR
jgi:predicted DNA-binding protein